MEGVGTGSEHRSCTLCNGGRWPAWAQLQMSEKMRKWGSCIFFLSPLFSQGARTEVQGEVPEREVLRRDHVLPFLRNKGLDDWMDQENSITVPNSFRQVVGAP